MPRNYLYVVIGAMAFAMVSAGVYGLLNVHLIPANSDPAKVPDYTAQLDSLDAKVNSVDSQVQSLRSQVGLINSEINSISSNITSLKTVQTNLADIHEKMADLQNLSTSVADIQSKLSDIAGKGPQQQPSTGQILVSLDKSSYLPGDTVHISAVGAPAQQAVQVQLLDSSGFALTGQTTWADSTGSVLYGLQLSSALLPGQYQIKLSSGQDAGSQSLTVASSSATAGSSVTFTAQTDKGIYQGGDLIQVTGMAVPASTVAASMKSPSGTTISSGTTANSDGSYTIVLSTSSSYEAGTWIITVTNLSQTRTVSVFLESAGSSTSTGTFTAQTDKASYQPGDLIQVSGTAQPSSTVTAVMTSPSQGTYSTSTTANSDGTYTMIFSTSTSYQAGNWNISVSNLGQSKTMYFTMGSGASSGSVPFTAQTDKASYQRGDLVQIAGDAQPGSAVDATLVSPSGTTYDTSATTNSNGNYVMFFSTTASYPAGNWYAEVTNSGQTKILSFNLQ